MSMGVKYLNNMKNKHGGKRPNSGAKLKYGEETKTISFRVPKSKADYFKKLMQRLLKDMTKVSN